MIHHPIYPFVIFVAICFLMALAVVIREAWLVWNNGPDENEIQELCPVCGFVKVANTWRPACGTDILHRMMAAKSRPCPFCRIMVQACSCEICKETQKLLTTNE